MEKITYQMSISNIGEELEGVIDDPEVIVHGQNRATLIRKAERELREKHKISTPIVKAPVPTGAAGNRY